MPGWTFVSCSCSLLALHSIAGKLKLGLASKQNASRNRASYLTTCVPTAATPVLITSISVHECPSEPQALL